MEQYDAWYDEENELWYAIDGDEKCYGGWYTEQEVEKWIKIRG